VRLLVRLWNGLDRTLILKSLAAPLIAILLTAAAPAGVEAEPAQAPDVIVGRRFLLVRSPSEV